MGGNGVATKPTRKYWMDVLRGIAVILVVVIHAIGVTAMNTGHSFNRLASVIEVLAPLRMPMLFILSGMLVPRSLTKGPRTYLSGKIRRVLYPYLLFAFIMLGLHALAYATMGRSNSNTFWDVFISPADHMWFLAYLFIYYLFALVLKRVPPLLLAAGSLFFYSLNLSWLPDEAASFRSDWLAFWSYAIPFFIGIAIGIRSESIERLISRTVLAWILLGGAVAFSLGRAVGILSYPSGAWTFPLWIMFFIGAAGVVLPFSERRFLAPMRYIGTRTVKLYVLHYPIILFGTYWLSRYTDAPPMIVLALSLVAGLGVPLMVMWVADRFPVVEWLFEAPAFSARGGTTSGGSSSSRVRGG